MQLPPFMNKLTIKGYMILFLSVLAFIGAFQQGFLAALFQLLIALAVTVILDELITFARKKKWIVPSSAVISALFIGSILPVGTKWYLVVLAAAIAVLSKHILRFRSRHIFNPANLGLLAIMVFFNTPMLWWGSSVFALVILFGLFAAWRQNKLVLVAAFAVSHSLLMLIHAYFVDISFLQHILLLNPFFLLFMVTEPKTSPIGKKPQIVYGIFLAAIEVAILYVLPQFDHSIIGLAIANISVPFLNRMGVKKSNGLQKAQEQP